jgi:hypothetical protein
MENTTLTSTETSPAIWAERIAALPFEKSILKATARIIWWDHFSHREYKERWNQLDKWLGYDGENVDTPTLQLALEKVGYPPAEAKKRVKSAE